MKFLILENELIPIIIIDQKIEMTMIIPFSLAYTLCLGIILYTPISYSSFKKFIAFNVSLNSSVIDSP